MMKYNRILLKISGEALGGEGQAFAPEKLEQVAAALIELVRQGVQVAVVVGGGNIWRGKQGISSQMDPTTADYMGMLATIINALALQDTIERAGKGMRPDGGDIQVRVQTAIEMRTVAEQYTKRRAVSHLEKGHIVIFGGGTGNPFFTTDTAAALRATEIGAQVILLAKNVDGVYSADPKLDPAAVKYDTISFEETLAQNLKVMDNTAVAHCMNNHLPLIVFALMPPSNILAAAQGRPIGTYVGS
jgi:uridylate kinase